jgi:lysophospholipase L1-like esterase
MRVIAPLGLLLASLVVAAGLLEVALRVLPLDVASFHSIAGFTVYDPVLGWKLAPNRALTFRGAHFSVRVVHNPAGLRDRHYDYARTPDRRRIVVLGDSVVWCWGVEQAECFTERLERALGDTDVVNAGVPGYSTAQELLFYEHEGRRYRPDVVVLVVSPNDADDNLDRRGPRFRLDGGTLDYDAAPPPRRRSVVHEWLQSHSRLYAWLGYVGPAVDRAWRTTAPERGANVPTAAVDTGVPTSPTATLPTPVAWALTEALFGRLQRDVEADGARLVVVLEMMSERLRTWQRGYWAGRGVPCLELASALLAAEAQGEHVRLEGDPHLSSAGQVVLARELERVLGAAAVLPARR